MKDTINSIKFHHFGLALKDFKNALKFYKNLNYNCTDPVIDPLQKVELILCTSSVYPAVELIKAINNQSPIQNYLKKNNEIIYHVCYKVSGIDIDEFFKNSSTICVSKPKPAILFNNKLVSFYYIKDVGLIEILQG